MFLPEPVDFIVPAVIFAIVSIGINFVTMYYKHFVGKRTKTVSLVADA